jgi:hypothetical protein
MPFVERAVDPYFSHDQLRPVARIVSRTTMPETTKQFRRPLHGDAVAILRQRRRVRRRSFLLAEMLSLTVLIGSILAGISQRFAADSFTPLFRILPIAAALVAAILPIIYFSNPQRRLR